VTKHGKTEVYVVAAEEFEKLKAANKPKRTGRAIIEAFRDPRLPKDFTFSRDSVYSPVRQGPFFDDEESPAK
jgi:hypothetical protein